MQNPTLNDMNVSDSGSESDLRSSMGCKRRRTLVEFADVAERKSKKPKTQLQLSAATACEAKIKLALQQCQEDVSKIVPYDADSVTPVISKQKITKKRPGKPGNQLASSKKLVLSKQTNAFPDPRRVRKPQENGQDQRVSQMRFDQSRMAESLRITHLWSETGPLEHSRYFWPNCNAGMNDQSLVRIDWIIDYLSNMLLIDQTPTTLERYKTIFDYGQVAQRYHAEFDALQEETTDDPLANTINIDSVPCSEQPYWFDQSVFTARRDSETNFREERSATAKSLADVFIPNATNRKSDKTKKANDSAASATGTTSEDSEVLRKNDSYGADELETLEEAFSLDFTLLRPMFVSDYERQHPHRMSPLHQRLFIGHLNGFHMKHSEEDMQSLSAYQVARRVFGLENRPCSEWAHNYITGFARQMGTFILNLLSRIKQKKKELQYVYGVTNAEMLERMVYIKRIRQIQWQVTTMMKLLLVEASAFQKGYEPNVPEHPTTLMASVISPSVDEADAYADMTAEQRCLRRLLERCQANHYKRHNGCIYEQRFSRGCRTNAYEKKQTIEEFVYTLPDMNLQMTEWKEMTKNSRTTYNLVQKLQNINDPQHLPDLVRQQFVWSFKNGIYDGSMDKFWFYKSEEIFRDPASPYFRLESSARFIDKDFDYENLMSEEAIKNPCTIRVKALTKILDAQGLDAETQRWTFGFTGRLYMPIGMFDNWGVVFWVRGLAGTGKSTYSHSLQAVYDVGDVGFLSNTVEVPFGLAPLSDKFLIIAPEIKTNCTLGESDFQTMATGDEMALPVKFGLPKYVPHWTVPQVYLSNDMPRWADAAGAIQRRIMQLMFGCVIAEKDKDTSLEADLKKNLDALIVRACRTYKHLRQEVGNGSVWDKVPPAFAEARDSVRNETVVMASFLEEVLVVDEEQRRNGKSDTDHFVCVQDLELLHRYKHRDISTQKNSTRFGPSLARDIQSFCHMKIETTKLDKTKLIRGCRLHLPVARRILDNQQWLPETSHYVTKEELIANEKQETPAMSLKQLNEKIMKQNDALPSEDMQDTDNDPMLAAAKRAEKRFDKRNE